MYQTLQNVDDWHERLIIASEYRLNYAKQCNHRDKYQWQIACDELKKSRSKIFLSSNGEIEGIPDAIKPDSIIHNTFKNIMDALEAIELDVSTMMIINLNKQSELNQSIVKRKRLLSENHQIATMIRTNMNSMDIDEETVWNLYEQGILGIEEHQQDLNAIDLTDSEVVTSSSKTQCKHHSSHRRYDSSNTREDIIFDLTNDNDTIIVNVPKTSRSISIIDLTEEDNHELITNTSQPMEDHTIIDDKNVKIPSNAKYTLLVDTRERYRNSTYREFFKNIQLKSDTKSGVNSAEKQLNIGDIMLCFTTNTSTRSSSSNTNEINILATASIIIERKCLNDIIQRSTEGFEGPHFRQEKNLRCCGLKYPFFMIEGDLNHVTNLKPLVSNGKEIEQLQRSDVIQNKDDLVRYMIGITCRNIGEYNVKVLRTVNISDTCMLIAALSAIASYYSNNNDIYTSKQLIHPCFQSFQKHWLGNTRNKRENQFLLELNQLQLSSDMIDRIKRRFGEENVLATIYKKLCTSNITKYTLLCDLSIAPSNEYVITNENIKTLGNISMRNDNHKIYNYYNPLNKKYNQDNLINLKREIVIRYNNNMLNYYSNINNNSNSDVISNLIITNKDDHINDIAWCELFIKSSINNNTTTTNNNTTTTNNSNNNNNNNTNRSRISSKIYFIVLSGYDIIESLADAYDLESTILVNNNVNNNINNNAINSEQTLDFELKIINKTIELLKNKFPNELINRIKMNKNNQNYPQIIIFLDHLGNGIGINGSSGKLKNKHTDSINTNNKPIQLDKKRKLISYESATYLTSKLNWLINLFIGVLQLKHNYQIYHTSKSNSIEYFISLFMIEYKRLSFLLYEQDNSMM